MTESTIVVAVVLSMLLAVREWQWRRRFSEESAEAYDAGFAAGLMWDEDVQAVEQITAHMTEPTDVHGEDAPDRYPN